MAAKTCKEFLDSQPINFLRVGDDFKACWDAATKAERDRVVEKNSAAPDTKCPHWHRCGAEYYMSGDFCNHPNCDAWSEEGK